MYLNNRKQCKIKSIWVAQNLVKVKYPFLHKEPKTEKLKNLRKSDAGKLNLEKTDFFQNAKFVTGLPNGYSPFEKMVFFACHFFSAVFTAFFCIHE